MSNMETQTICSHVYYILRKSHGLPNPPNPAGVSFSLYSQDLKTERIRVLFHGYGHYSAMVQVEAPVLRLFEILRQGPGSENG